MNFHSIKTESDDPVFCIIGDVHRGIGRDNEWMLGRQDEWFTEWLFPLLKEKGVDVVIQTGDFFDHRRHITHKTMQRTRKNITEFVAQNNIPWIVIPGNHDIYHREHITPNSVKELLGHIPNIHVFEQPATVKLGNFHWDFIPWICAENKNDVYEYIDYSHSEYCVGHFELGGFLYYAGMTSSGESCGFLKNYLKVFSGHYHAISSGANVQYVGTPYTLTMSDADDDRGVWIGKSSKATDAEFVPGPGTWHIKRVFDANEWAEKDTQEIIDRGSIVVQFMITNAVSDDGKTSIESVERFLLESGVHDVRKKYADMISGDLDQEDQEQAIEDLRARSPLSILRSWISEQVEDRDKRNAMKKIVDDLYAEANVEK